MGSCPPMPRIADKTTRSISSRVWKQSVSSLSGRPLSSEHHQVIKTTRLYTPVGPPKRTLIAPRVPLISSHQRMISAPRDIASSP